MKNSRKHLIFPSSHRPGGHIPVMRWELCEFRVPIMTAWESVGGSSELSGPGHPAQIGPLNIFMDSGRAEPH